MSQKAKKVLLLTAILILAFGLTSLRFQPSNASRTLTVPTDYSSISEAINHASNGDTIVVQSGVYYENLQVNKSISINSQDPKTTIIIGAGGLDRGANPVVALNAPDSKIEGFTIKSQTYNSTNLYATGIIIRADNCIIQNNIIQRNYMGIFYSVQSYLQITDNTIAGNLKDGMRFYGGSHNIIADNSILDNGVSGLALQGYSNTVTNNTFEGNTRGLGLGSSYSVVYGNHFNNNSESGIWLAASKNIIAANDFSSNKWGIFITPQWAAPHDNTLYHNNFVANVNGVFVNESAPVQYWDNGSEGNYWSDYQTKNPYAKEVGTSGVADKPYTVYADTQDHYPLIAPFDTTKLGNPPAANPTPEVASNGLVASWSFDKIDSNGVSLDSTGNNPAILGSTTVNKSYIPKTVAGHAGNALSFDGQQYVVVPASPSLEISGEVTVDVWINVQAYKPIPYNNIIVEALRTTDALPTRTFGLAINGEAPQNDTAPALGAIRAYVLTKDGLNEIVTTKSVITLNQWMHVVFVRSLTTGMHIYVDGTEQEVRVTAGSVNPQGVTLRQTETYIGHDAISTIDELNLSNKAVPPEQQPLWMQGWLWAALFAVIAASGLGFYGWRRVRSAKKAP